MRGELCYFFFPKLHSHVLNNYITYSTLLKCAVLVPDMREVFPNDVYLVDYTKPTMHNRKRKFRIDPGDLFEVHPSRWSGAIRGLERRGRKPTKNGSAFSVMSVHSTCATYD